MEKKTDAGLVALARSGDKGAFGILVERYQRMAERIAKGVVGNEEISRELAQEALLQAYLSIDRLRNDGSFRSWLYGIVLNVCRSLLREQKTAPYSLEALTGGLRYEGVLFRDPEPDPQEVAEAQELHKLVVLSVNALSPKNRVATLLYYYEQLSVREIAATLGVSEAVVKGRLHKSRLQLRELLLPAYSDMYLSTTPREGGRTMVKVTIADVTDRGYQDKETGLSYARYAVMLLDSDGRRILPIWVGPAEGRAIALGLRKPEVPRPMTFSFMARVLEALGAKLEEARIEELKGDTFYAVAKLRIGGRDREVDARPSDAMALAVQTGSPIYVAEEVMERAGFDIPEEAKEAAEQRSQGKGIDRIVREFKEHGTKMRQAGRRAGAAHRDPTRALVWASDDRLLCRQ